MLLVFPREAFAIRRKGLFIVVQIIGVALQCCCRPYNIRRVGSVVGDDDTASSHESAPSFNRLIHAPASLHLWLLLWRRRRNILIALRDHFLHVPLEKIWNRLSFA
jgi:hypothetical protein